VRLWDPTTGALVGEPRTGHTDWVTGLAVATPPDSRMILPSGSTDKTVRLWSSGADPDCLGVLALGSKIDGLASGATACSRRARTASSR
jgi:WD40 repeat protein